MALGAVLGVLVSLSSVGAGAIGVTALLLLYPKLPTARIVGSDIAHAVPLTLLAGAAIGGSARSTGRCWSRCWSARAGHRDRQRARLQSARQRATPGSSPAPWPIGGKLAF